MVKNIISTVFLCCIFISSFAQGKISGNVVDGATGEAVAFANAVLYENEKVLKGTATDTVGAFILENIPYGKYKLAVDFVSYKTEVRQIEITPSKEVIRLKTIVLQEDKATMLREVEIVGIASQTKFDIDKKIYTINQSALSAGAGTDEILRNIPSVNVDNEGNISLRNDENVAVWINGKPSGLTPENRGQILEQLPAESVQSVEVITNPSSKYNPEGTSGIINIVLRQDRKAGYYGTASVGVSYPWGANFGGNVNYSNKKFNSYFSLNYRNNKNIGGGWLDRSSFGKDSTFLRQRNNSENRMQGLFVRAGADYQFNAKNNLGISAFTMLGGSNQNTDYNYFLQDNFLQPIDSYSQNTSSDIDRRGYNFSIDYKHIFDKNGHEFLASAGNSGFVFNTNTDYITTRKSINSTRDEDVSRNSQEFWLQADYTLPLGEKSKLEAGYKSTFSPTQNILKRNSVLEDDFTLNRQIHAVYANYKNMFKPLDIGYLVGVRGEATITDWKNIDTKGNSAHYDWFPSVFLSKIFGKNNELQISLTRRINRPGRRELNPLRDTSDSTNIRFGNPNLNPAYSMAYELNYIKKWDNHTLSTSAYLRQTDDIIQSVSEIDSTHSYMLTTYKNIASRQNSGFELSLKNRFFRKVELTSTVNLYYSKLFGNAEYGLKDRESFSWDARVICNTLITKGFSVQLTGNYRSSSLLPQGKTLPNYSLDAGLKKTFSEKITVNLSVRDIFNSRKFRSEIFSDNFYQKSERYFQGRTIRLTVSYNFGNLKPTKKPQRKEEDVEPDIDM